MARARNGVNADVTGERGRPTCLKTCCGSRLGSAWRFIAALLAQGAESKTAQLAGVYLHGAAAEHAASNGAGPVALTASETINATRFLLNHRQRGKSHADA